MKGKFYLIGHKGFIGKSVVDLIPTNKTVFLGRDDIEKITSNQKSIEFSPHDVLLNLAWSNLDNFRSPLHITETLPEHIKFYESILRMGIRNITALGTCLEYGVIEGELEESIVANPNLPYAIAKDSIRRYLEYKKNDHEFNLNWIRVFYIYGKGQSKRTIYGQLVDAVENNEEKFAMSHGLQKRDYLHVKDVAKKIVKIALSGQSAGIINCCSGRPISMIDFVRERLVELGALDMELDIGKFPYQNYEGLEFWGSIKKLSKAIGESNE